MSYARLGDDSDVYVPADEEAGYLRCIGCGADFSSTAATIEHLRGHIVGGDAVPARTIPALEAD
jgi:elongation factor P hydroxylase